MNRTIRALVAGFGALVLATGIAAAQSKPKVAIAVGGAGCLCYLPTVLAKQLGEYDKAGVEVELIDFKGGSQALQAVIGGSADVVSGYYDHFFTRNHKWFGRLSYRTDSPALYTPRQNSSASPAASEPDQRNADTPDANTAAD